MIKYSGIYESSTPPPSTKALWVDGGVLKIYKNGSWRPVDDPKSKLTIDSSVKEGSTNPVSGGAVHTALMEKADSSKVEAIKDHLEALAIKTDKIGTLRDLYISAGAKYNEQTGYYELNGLTDITEAEMRVIYEKTWGWWLHLPALNGFGTALPRTNIPCPDYKIIAYASNISLNSIFSISHNDDNLEVVNLRALYTPTNFDEIKIIDFNWAFQRNKKIREVQGIINIMGARGNQNIGGNIETINIKGLKVSISFYNSQRLSKESVLYMINNSEATTAITIGLNKAVYDVMKGDADIIAALAEKTNITLIQNT
jgi:hypothetical protein